MRRSGQFRNAAFMRQRRILQCARSNCLRIVVIDTGQWKPIIGKVMLTEDDIKTALKTVKYPGYSRDIVSFGLVKEIACNDGAVSVSLQLTGGNPEAARQIKEES